MAERTTRRKAPTSIATRQSSGVWMPTIKTDSVNGWPGGITATAEGAVCMTKRCSTTTTLMEVSKVLKKSLDRPSTRVSTDRRSWNPTRQKLQCAASTFDKTRVQKTYLGASGQAGFYWLKPRPAREIPGVTMWLPSAKPLRMSV
jgi:hypothetical protein